MEASGSSDSAALNGLATLGPPAGHNSPVAWIFQFPTELLIRIFQFALPSADMLKGLEPQLRSYMRTLYTIRLIAKRSQEMVDGTPVFWKFVISTWPAHVNEATIVRSKNGPLTIMCTPRALHKRDPRPSAQDFLSSLAHTFPRWSAYYGPLVSGYFHTPAPHLQTIALSSGDTSIGPLDLLGGRVEHLRHVDLTYVPIRWRAGLGFVQLKVLKLIQASEGEFQLTTTHLLDALLASPCLERLELGHMRGPIDHPPSSPAITHLCLRSIRIYGCGHTFAGAILRRIRAPFCIEFYVDEVLPQVEEDHSQVTFWDEDLRNCKEILRAIHSQNGFSKITLDNAVFGWNSFAENVAENLPTFDVWLDCFTLMHRVEWIEDILQDNPGPPICLSLNSSILQEVMERIMSMRCVTRLELLHLWGDGAWRLLALKFIGEPLSTDPSSPPLPCLQELLLTGAEWPPQNILDMVRSRFNPSLWESTERTPLTIKISRGASPTGTLSRLIFDLATLTRIRDTDGVECVQFLGSEELDGTLAVTWDEKNSAPTWD